MYLTAEGGCSIYSITKELDKRGFILAGRPMFGPVPTIGAWVNTVGIGGNCSRYGYFSENVTGIEVVLPTAQIVRTGVNGLNNCDPFCRYTHTSDLTGLFVGSRGALGVVTEVSTRIFPKPETVNFITLGFTKWDPLIKAAYKILRADIPATIDINDDGLGEIVGMNIPLPLLISITVEGAPAEVQRKIEVVRKIAVETGGVDMGSGIGSLIYYGGAMTAYIYKKQGFGHLVYADAYWHTLDTFPAVYKSFKEICAKYGLTNNCIFGWMMKGIACTFPIVAYKEPEQWEDMRKAWKEICDAWFAVKNVAPGMSVPSPTEYNLDPLRPTHRELLTTIKQTLDPNNIMNSKVYPTAGGNQ
jgi:FAD/FMN-containing dehydrogenase